MDDSERQLFSQKGLSGLKNLGNTCFMNTAIQCLSNTLPLTYYFLTKKYIKDIKQERKETGLVIEWFRLLEGMWDSNCTISPNSFVKEVQKLSLQSGINMFAGHDQNDIQEFIEFFINNIHEGICKEVEIKITGTPQNQVDHMAIEAMKSWKNYFKSNYSICIDLFYGQYISKVMSEEDDTDFSHTYEPFCHLALPIPNKENVNIFDCLKCFCKVEKVNWKSEKYNKEVESLKQMMFWRTPKFLIITLKRYNNDGNKKNCLVSFPINNLNLKNYCVGYDKDSSVYDLYGICNHIGNSNFGHYWAYCKNEDGNWYKYDDNDVTIIGEDELVSTEAYCLFYKKK